MSAAAPASTTAVWRQMVSGAAYWADDPALVALRQETAVRCRRLAAIASNSGAARALLEELLGSCGDGVRVEPPLHCDYGVNVTLGAGAYLNTGCVLLDCAPIDIGAGTLVGPGVHIYAATHPIEPSLRRSGLEHARRVRIGRDVWIGGGSIICPGVSIGDETVIGAGSVVTRDVAARRVAAGNPCRVLREVGDG